MMKVNVNKFLLGVYIIAIAIPSYFFFQGQKILNLIYLVNAFLFLFFFLPQTWKISGRLWEVAKGTKLYILSIILFAAQAMFDTDLLAGTNILLSTAAVVIIVLVCVAQEKTFRWVINGIIYLSIPLLLMGILETLMKSNVFQISPLTLRGATFYVEQRIGIYRIASVFGHPIVYCNYLSILSALVVYRLSWKTKRGKLLLWTCYVLILINAILTVSRSTIFIIIGEQLILFHRCGTKWFTSRKILFVVCVIFILMLSDAFGSGIVDKISDMLNMLLQVFGLGTSSYSVSFSNTGYSGVAGDRWRLYGWVYQTVSPDFLFGKGTNAPFKYLATEFRVKTSIENYYLSLFYAHGLFGLLVGVAGLTGIVAASLRAAKVKTRLFFEKRLSFGFTMAIVLVGYIISLFMVNQSGETRLLYICIGLLAAYCSMTKEVQIPYEE